MKLLFLLFVTAIIAIGVHAYTKRLGITLGVVIILLGLITFGMYKTSVQSDLQCSGVHPSAIKPPTNLKTAMDYFLEGNYDYDIGNCTKAVADYTKAIALNPNYVEAYNNRAYTNMRLRNYKDALPDLDKAIQLDPNYISALMNRGDIHNYYYQINRQAAISDYEKVISLGGIHETSVCGHLLLAEHDGWNLGTILDLPKTLSTCN